MQSVLLVSPFVSLVSSLPSRKPKHPIDTIEDGGLFIQTLGYLGVAPPYADERLASWKRYSPSWNPIDWFSERVAADPPPAGLIEDISVEEAESAGGLKLLSSPYVNPTPSVVKDLSWYAQALLGDGRTLVNWGASPLPFFSPLLVLKALPFLFLLCRRRC
jgi:hypothetical protein